MDTINNSTSDDESRDTVSPEIVLQVRAALADLLSKTTPVPPVLEGLPVELWLERIVPIAVAAELLCLTPETVLKRYRSMLIQLTGASSACACATPSSSNVREVGARPGA